MQPCRTDMRGGRPIKTRARTLRTNSTDAERALWRELRQWQLGHRFRRQFPIPPYIADFVCVEARLIVEADGGQHNLSDSDAKRDKFLTAKGWRLLRFWNNDILQNRAGVLQIIAEALGTYPHPDPPPLAGVADSLGDGAVDNRSRIVPYPVGDTSSPPLTGEGPGGGV